MPPELPSVQDQVASLWGSGDRPPRAPGSAAARAPAHALDAAGPECDEAGQSALRLGQKITLRIPGKPQPGGSKRAFTPKGWDRPVIVDANPKAMDWKRTVQAFALATAAGRILDGPLRVSMTFVVARPKGHFGVRGLRPSAPAYPAVKPDVLKLARSTEDALTGIIWTDDARIVVEILRKLYTTDGKTGAVIEIEEIVG